MPGLAPRGATPARPKPAATRGLPWQARLTVGATQDRFEREANRIADAVTSGQAPTTAGPPPVISGLAAQRVAAPTAPGPEQIDEEAAAPERRAQRAGRGNAPEAPKEEPETTAQRAAKPAIRDEEKPAAAQREAQPGIGAAGGTAPAPVEATVQRLRARPAPGLDGATRETMERHTGTDLGGVRVHADRAAGEAAAALNARAFTVGEDVFFGAGQYDTQSAAGRHLIAHEVAHTVQQRGGSASAQRIQRAGDGKSTSTVTPPAQEGGEPTPEEPKKTKKLPVDAAEDAEWLIDLETGGRKTIRVPKLELPLIDGKPKGWNGENGASAGALPQLDQKYVRLPQAPRKARDLGVAKDLWLAELRKKDKLDAIAKSFDGSFGKLKDTGDLADAAGTKVYVLQRAGAKGDLKAGSAEFFLIGTTAELAENDGVLRPMLSKSGAALEMDADHNLEDQLNGANTIGNLWLLDRGYNRSIGPQIESRWAKQISATVSKAQAELEAAKKQGYELDGKLDTDVQVIRQNWAVEFRKVVAGDFGREPKGFWTRDQIGSDLHLKLYRPLATKELFEQGFAFDPSGKVRPKVINVFPTARGGRPIRFRVAKDGKSLERPGYFFRGIDVVAIAGFAPPDAATKGGVIATLTVRRFREHEGPDILEVQWGDLEVRHDPVLGFGGYIPRESVRAALAKGQNQFFFLSPIGFADAEISPDGELMASGTIASAKALFPGLQVPILLRGEDVLIQYPVPTESLNFGPVQVTEAALELGVGAKGFYIQGSAGIAVEQLGSGTLTARATKDDVVIAGKFLLALDFLDKAEVEASYSLAKDEFSGKAELKTRKDALPGVESGTVVVTISRESFGLVGSLQLGGILAGSTITVGYTPETGLLIEGKDLPLPVDKLPGVSEAKVTVRAVRSPDTGEWAISGGGKAALAAGGATGTLDILFDGVAVTFQGRATVAKGPASGWLDVTATNRAVDDKGEPIEGGPVGELRIWGKGEATIKFGKVLQGTAGIEYTPEGHVILSGEIALPPTFDLFPKVDYTKKLLELSPPDFPIWGVKVGPVGIGIFAFVDAIVTFNAYVGPGQLRDTRLGAVIDLEKPEEATVSGKAQFFVPSFAGFTLDLGGGLKAQVAVAYVKGRVGLDGTLGVGLDASLEVGVEWNAQDGLAVGGRAAIKARPKFELGVNASVFAGVDLGITEIEKEWGPWREKLGEFGPDLELEVAFPMKWSEKEGLDLSLDNIEVKAPSLDAGALMKSAFDTLV